MSQRQVSCQRHHSAAPPPRYKNTAAIQSTTSQKQVATLVAEMESERWQQVEAAATASAAEAKVLYL